MRWYVHNVICFPTNLDFWLKQKTRKSTSQKKRPSFWEKGPTSDVPWIFYQIPGWKVEGNQATSNPTTPMHDLQTLVLKFIQLLRVSRKQCWVRRGKKVHLPLDQCHVLYVPINQKNRNNRNVHEPTLTETQKILRFSKKHPNNINKKAFSQKLPKNFWGVLAT